MSEIRMIDVWLEDCFHRIYPQSQVGKQKSPTLLGALNERQALQIAVRNKDMSHPVGVSVSVDSPKELKIRIRCVGYVPIPRFNTPIMDFHDCEGLGHIPGYAPDPLFDEKSMIIPPQQTHAFWVDVIPAKDVSPGKYQIEISVSPDVAGRSRKLKASIELADIKIKPRKNFHITHWFYPDALLDWYKTDGYDERLWQLLAAYMRNLKEHGQDTILVPLFTPPIDGVKTPCQLLKVKKIAKGKYKFDFSDVKRFIDLAKKAGLKYFEWMHLATQWGAEHAIRVYESSGKTYKLLWKPQTKATSRTYKIFLRQLLPAWHEFLVSNHLLKKSFFHLSDEPHGHEHLANYRAFREFLREEAPWLKVIDALSDINFAQAGLTDTPAASENVVLDFIDNNISCWTYYCCGPREKFLNHLMDTPLAKIAMHGLLFYRWKIGGFLHWGYNFWYRRHTTDLIDPFTVSDAGAWPYWPHGDTFLVYPGEDGPIDSIRWEVFALAMQDYALLETLGVNRDDKQLREICSFEDFPKNADWRLNFRRTLFRKIINNSQPLKHIDIEMECFPRHQ